MLSWTMEGNVKDKGGPRGSGEINGRRLDAVCAKDSKVMEEYCDECKFSTVCMNLSRKESVQAGRQQPACRQLCSVTLASRSGA
jgi:hypothetical protein